MTSFLTISMSIDLSQTSPFATGSVMLQNYFGAPSALLNLNYDSDWTFDSTTILSICSDFDGSLSVTCSVQNLKVTYKIPDFLEILPFSNLVTMMGDYKLNEGNGNILTDSQSNLGTVFLTSPSPPTWTSELGLQFETSNQYVELPTFFPQDEDNSITISVGFAFYIKIGQTPTAPDNKIFSYYCNSLTDDVFSLAITPNLRLKTTIRGSSHQVPQTLSLGSWAQVYVFYSFTSGAYGISKIYLNGIPTDGFAVVAVGTTPPVFSPTDVVKIGGGFVGHLKRLQVYSPAALPFIATSGSNSCDPTTCSLDMGFANPRTCMQAVCNTPGTYSSFGTCERKEQTSFMKL